jgi:hypothetical protein
VIELPDRRIAIMTPPKCATHTLHAVFCAPPWCGRSIVGPTVSDPQKLDRHVRQWPNELVGYRKLVVVRHPLDRLVSLFLHFVRFEAAEGRGTPCFADFGRWVVGPERPDAFAPQLIYQWNLSKWLEGVEWDGVVNVESLADDLRREGLVVESLPCENASYRVRPWHDFYMPDLLELVRPWAQTDCEQFGYDWPAVIGE